MTRFFDARPVFCCYLSSQGVIVGNGLFELGCIGSFSGLQLREVVFSFHIGHAYAVFQGLVRTHIISFRKAIDWAAVDAAPWPKFPMTTARR
jgi:hypothetical protein